MLGPALGELVSLGSRYAFYRSWRNVLALSGVVVLCAAAAVLVDLKMYLSAGVVGVVGVAGLFFFVAQVFRVRRKKKEHERRKAEEAAHRAIAGTNSNASGRARPPARRNQRCDASLNPLPAKERSQ
jgi:Flp pilus assembly protein TadB